MLFLLSTYCVLYTYLLTSYYFLLSLFLYIYNVFRPAIVDFQGILGVGYVSLYYYSILLSLILSSARDCGFSAYVACYITWYLLCYAATSLYMLWYALILCY